MKKALSLVLAVMMILGMSTMVSAATKITGVDTTQDAMEFVGYTDGTDLVADQDIIIAINPAFFTGASAITEADLTESNFRSSKVTVRRSISKGSDLIESVAFDTKAIDNPHTGSTNVKQAVIKIELVEHFVSVSDKDLSMKVRLYLDGSNEAELSLDATMVIDDVDVYEDDDYVFLGDGQVAKAQDYVRNVEVDLGNGVTMKINMFDGRKYYGIAINEITSADDEIMSKYPTIENVLTIKQVNLKNSGNYVTLDLDDTYYVYNTEGEYIGKSNETLPYSDKYYLSSTQIEMAEAADPGEDGETTEPTDEGELPEDLGGNADVDNLYDNPGTGVNGLVNVAIVAGVVALAAAGAVSMKK